MSMVLFVNGGDVFIVACLLQLKMWVNLCTQQNTTEVYFIVNSVGAVIIVSAGGYVHFDTFH